SRGLTYLAYESRAVGFTSKPRLLGVIARANAKLLAEQVPDPVRREQLRPSDLPGCKRVLLSNDYYPAVAGEDCTVVTHEIERITGAGIRTVDEVDHDLDVIVYGTGFAANDFLAGIRVVGVDGDEIHDRWTAAEGAESSPGGTVAGFPNLVLLYGPNTNLAHNSILYMLESQFAHVLSLLQAMADRSATVVAPRPDRQYAWNAWVGERMTRTAFVAGCHSWYVNAQGKHTNNWPSSTPAYRRRVRDVNPADYEFSTPG
ncbi:MAG TPA: 4-hydroxyacetophenone monooxygenase, partial [Mycobacteriales bacterium]